MDTKKRNEDQGKLKNQIRHGFMHKAVASLAAAFFVFCGISVPTSFADMAPITLSEDHRQVSVITLDQANAGTEAKGNELPSGIAVKEPGALSVVSIEDSKNVSNDLVVASEGSLPAGTFAPGQCSNPDFSSSAASTSCVGTILTSDGAREIHTYNQRGNTGIIIYNNASGTSQSISLPSFSGISPDNFSKDGKYLAVIHSGNQITVLCMESMSSAGTVSIPVWSGSEDHGTPKIDEVRAESSTQFFIHVDDSQIPTVTQLERSFRLDVGAQGHLTLTPVLSAGEFQAGGCTVADQSTSVSSTACVGFVGTPEGLREIHTYNQRGNAGLIIYDLEQNTSRSFSLPALKPIKAAHFSSDGKYLIASYSWNQVSVISLTNLGIQEVWTRATSNADYAFHVKREVVGGYTVRTLQVMNLRTGEVSDVVKTQPPAIPTFSRYDVSADGKAVIYEMNGYMQVQRIGNPNMVWVGGGIPTSTIIRDNLVIFVYPDGTRVRINTENLPIRPPVGWTKVSSTSNLAYKNIGGVIKVMNLTTGAISNKPSSQSIASQVINRQGLYYVVTSTGLKEIYSVTIGRISFLMSYDPVKKSWAFYRK